MVKIFLYDFLDVLVKHTDFLSKTNSTRFRNWPWGENWILCDQLAMVAAITDDKAVVSDFVFEQQINTTQMATIREKQAMNIEIRLKNCSAN